MKKKFGLLTVAVLGLLVAPWIPTVQAGPILPITLTDLNSTVTIDPDDQTGLSSWVVDGVGHAMQKWYWFRLGGAGAEASVDTLPLTITLKPLSAGGVGPENILRLKYDVGGGTFIEIRYTLTGSPPGSQTSGLTEFIIITNPSGSTLHLFEYNDLDLGGSPGDDTVRSDGVNVFHQTDSGYFFEEVAGGSPVRHEAALFDTTRVSLNDGASTTLGLLTTTPTGTVGPDNVTFSYQWSFPGASSFSKTETLTAIPEPTSLLLLGCGLVGMATVAWRRQRKSRRA